MNPDIHIHLIPAVFCLFIGNFIALMLRAGFRTLRKARNESSS